VKIRILGAARKDLLEGYYFYENQSAGIGTYFLESLYSDIGSLVDHGGVHPVYFVEYHRLLSAKFPFAIYYKVMEDTVLVFAVLDCRREPAWIRSKLN
jgi:hypothetical protein